MRYIIPPKGFESNPLYHNGKIRNHPCFCGSGKKVKKCHGVHPFVLHRHARLAEAAIENDREKFLKVLGEIENQNKINEQETKRESGLESDNAKQEVFEKMEKVKEECLNGD